MPVARRRGRTRARAALRALQAAILSRYAPTHPIDDPPAARKDLPRQPSRSRSVQAPSASMARRVGHYSARTLPRPHDPALACPSLPPNHSHTPLTRSLSHFHFPALAPFAEKFSFHTPPFPNSSRTKLDLYPSSISPHSSRAIVTSPARNQDFPQIAIFGRRSTRTSRPHSEPSPRSTEHAISFLELHWCSRTLQTPTDASDLTGVAVAAAAPPPLGAGETPCFPGLPTPLMLFPHFPDPSSPSFGRRNSGESRGHKFIVFSGTKGAIPDGNYHLIPADEEEVPEHGAGEETTNPEANPQSEQEGKPRSIT
nr:unnamed protein product [Digitaria exilis]